MQLHKGVRRNVQDRSQSKATLHHTHKRANFMVWWPSNAAAHFFTVDRPRVRSYAVPLLVFFCQIFAEACRILTPGGSLAIMEMDPSAPGYVKLRNNPVRDGGGRPVAPTSRAAIQSFTATKISWISSLVQSIKTPGCINPCTFHINLCCCVGACARDQAPGISQLTSFFPSSSVV